MREAQEREGFWLCLPTSFPISFGKLPELDQPRLFRMQFQTELRQTLPKFLQKPLGFRSVFEAHHQIVGVSDDNHVALGHFLAPGFYP